MSSSCVAHSGALGGGNTLLTVNSSPMDASARLSRTGAVRKRVEEAVDKAEDVWIYDCCESNSNDNHSHVRLDFEGLEVVLLRVQM